MSCLEKQESGRERDAFYWGRAKIDLPRNGNSEEDR